MLLSVVVLLPIIGYADYKLLPWDCQAVAKLSIQEMLFAASDAAAFWYNDVVRLAIFMHNYGIQAVTCHVMNYSETLPARVDMGAKWLLSLASVLYLSRLWSMVREGEQVASGLLALTARGFGSSW